MLNFYTLHTHTSGVRRLHFSFQLEFFYWCRFGGLIRCFMLLLFLFVFSFFHFFLSFLSSFIDSLDSRSIFYFCLFSAFYSQPPSSPPPPPHPPCPSLMMYLYVNAFLYFLFRYTFLCLQLNSCILLKR